MGRYRILSGEVEVGIFVRRNDGGLSESSSSRRGRKWLDFGYVVKVGYGVYEIERI